MYSSESIIEALKFNSQEVIPGDQESLSKEVDRLVEAANSSNQAITQYIGFEISGEIHIGTGIMSALKIKRFTDAGVACKIWLADYHTFINNKLDGNIESIRRVAKEYFGPVMLECCKLVGCNMDLVEVLYAQEEYTKTQSGNTFWDYDMHVCKNLTLSRVLKSLSIAGREGQENTNYATTRYPAMMAADAFFLQTHIVTAGMDQRKAHVLMREVAYALLETLRLKIGDKEIKPLASHYALLHGLGKPVDGEVAKMSKSKPNSCIFVYDSPEDIAKKIKKAYCPVPGQNRLSEEEVKKLNPLLDWARKMIFPAGITIRIERKEDWGGDIAYDDYDSLEQDYLSGKLHPGDLKAGISLCLIEWFSPLREYIQNNSEGLDFLLSLKK